MRRSGASSAELEHNLKLIPILAGLSASAVYAPVLILFVRQHFGVSGVLQLASLSYLFIVVLEVPSGWMSDRLGRVPTLTVAAASWLIAQTCFLLGGDRFVIIALGQFFISAGYAFISGTDVSLHYDTLESLDRGEEYAQRQARVSSIGYLARMATAIAGGVLGFFDLRWAFVAALLFALTQLVVTRLLTEPASEGSTASAFVSQLGECLHYLTNRFMGWLFFYGIALVTLEHVAHTLMQPWLTEALGKEPDELGATPLLSGALLAVVAVVGAVAARHSATLGERFGLVPALVGLGALSAVIVTGMALSFSLIILALIACRSVQGAAAPVLLSAAIAPRTERHHRATLLSINSLAGRLGYGSLLQVLSIGIGDDPRPVLQIFSAISWGLVAVLVLTGSWAARNQHAVP